MANIGMKLKELRIRRGLGMRELALRSGISHSSVSLIERDRMSPSIDTLSAILDALGTTLVGFFTDLHSTLTYSAFYGANDFVEIGKAGAVSHRMLGINHPNRQLLMLQETYAVGAHSGSAYCHSAQEAGIVTRGEVELTVGSESRVLHVGDGYYFDSRLPHSFRNVSKGKSEIISAVTPPTY
jgi:transcriptional regulator with XRE-family HTH domain